ncbi:MAG: hypothetical protein V3T39_05440, partial [Gammaproteobacteria bacterium]
MTSFSTVVATSIAWFLLVLGFSYLLQAPRWIRISRKMMQEPEQAFPTMIILLLVGFFLVQIHNIWVMDWPVVVTVLGWLLVLKASWL